MKKIIFRKCSVFVFTVLFSIATFPRAWANHSVKAHSIALSAVVKTKTRDSKLVQVWGEQRFIRISRTPLLVNADFTESEITDRDEPAGLNLKTTASAAQKLKEFSSKNIGKQLALIVDGKVLMTPVIRTQLDQGKFVVSFSDNKIPKYLAD